MKKVTEQLLDKKPVCITPLHRNPFCYTNGILMKSATHWSLGVGISGIVVLGGLSLLALTSLAATGTPPTVNAVTLVSNNSTPTSAKTGDTVTLSFTSNQTSLIKPAVIIAGKTVVPTTVSTTSPVKWQTALTFAGDEPEGAVLFTVVVGNTQGTATTTVKTLSTGSGVMYSKNPPKVTTLTMSSPNGNVAYGGDTLTMHLVTDKDVQTPATVVAGVNAAVTKTPQPHTTTSCFFIFCSSSTSYTYSASDWSARVTLPSTYPEGPIPFFVGPLVDMAGNSGVVVTTLTSGSPISFQKTLSPLYCLWKKDFSSGPVNYQDHSYVLDSSCEPTAPIAQLTVSTVSTSTGTSLYTVLTRTNDSISTRINCSFLCFNQTEVLVVSASSTVQTTGTLPSYITTGDSVNISWECQPFENLLWSKFHEDFWGAFNLVQNNYTVNRFNYSTNPTGTGFSTGGTQKGTASVIPTDTANYTLSCGNSYLSPTFELNVDNPKGSISASPAQVSPGGNTFLTWSAKNVKKASCVITDPKSRVVGTPNKNSGQNVSSGPVPQDTGGPVIYTLTCKRYTGADISWQSNPVEVSDKCSASYDATKPQLCSFKATPPTVLQGGAVALKWYCPVLYENYALEASLDEGTTWSAITNGAVPGSGGERTYTISNGSGPQQDTTYRLTCSLPSGAKGKGTSAVTVAQPDLSSFSAVPYALTPAVPVTVLSWSAKNVNTNSCTVTDQSSGTSLIKNTNASAGLQATPVFSSLPVSYLLTCQTPASAAKKAPAPSKVVTVYEAGKTPTVSRFWANPSSVRKGSSSRLYWEGTNLPSSCNLSSNPLIPGLPSTVSSQPGGNNSGISTGSINQKTIFTLTCGPTGSGQATVGIIPIYQEI
jgi:hypothetical protein